MIIESFGEGSGDGNEMIGTVDERLFEFDATGYGDGWGNEDGSGGDIWSSFECDGDTPSYGTSNGAGLRDGSGYGWGSGDGDGWRSRDLNKLGLPKYSFVFDIESF